MTDKMAIIIAIVFLAVFVYADAYAQDPIPAGYEWRSPMGALKKSTKSENTYLFDTTSGNFLTDGKQTIVGYNITKKKGLTDLGVTLKGKLMKIDDVSDVAVEYRRIWIQKYPLSSWDTIMPQMKKVLQ